MFYASDSRIPQHSAFLSNLKVVIDNDSLLVEVVVVLVVDVVVVVAVIVATVSEKYEKF